MADDRQADYALFLAVSRGGNPVAAAGLIAAGARADFVSASPRAGGAPGSVATSTRMNAVEYQPETVPLLRGHPHAHLMDAAIDGDVEAVQRFLDGGESPEQVDVYGQHNPLRYAARLGHEAVVARLLAAGASPNPFERAPWNSPVVGALVAGHLACADLVWAAGGRVRNLIFQVTKRTCASPGLALAWIRTHEPDADLVQGLHTAIKYHQLETARWLLDAGVDVDARRHTETPLMVAAHGHNLPAVELLLAAGSDAHATNAHGETAMHYALSRDDDPEPGQPFTYTARDLERPVPKRLQAAGLAIPPPDDEAP